MLLGSGVLNAFPPTTNGGPPSGPSYAAPMAVGVSPAKSFTTVLFAAASGPEDSRAGWIVTSNATNDVIFVFSNISSAGPLCNAGVGPRGSMVAEYGLCAGSGIFPSFDHSYALAGLKVGVFAQPGGTTMRFVDEKACAPAVLQGVNSPFGTGAFMINVESGVPEAPPDSWSAPPSWCEGKWVAV